MKTGVGLGTSPLLMSSVRLTELWFWGSIKSVNCSGDVTGKGSLIGAGIGAVLTRAGVIC